MPSLTYSDNGLAMTEKFEGLELTAYQDQGGVWTIGYGHTGPTICGGQTITQDQAALLLQSDIARAVHFVNNAVTCDLNQNQFDALVDFAFNLGTGALLTSTLLRDINAGNCPNAADQFLLWDHCKGVVIPGLLARRQAERALFLTEVEADT